MLEPGQEGQAFHEAGAEHGAGKRREAPDHGHGEELDGLLGCERAGFHDALLVGVQGTGDGGDEAGDCEGGQPGAGHVHAVALHEPAVLAGADEDAARPVLAQ